MSSLFTVIPAAGKSQRFRDAGYSLPKPYLVIKDKNCVTNRMIGHVITSFPHSLKIIATPSDRLPLSNYDAMEHAIHQSVGQADTIYQVVKDLPKDSQILILDCDVVLQTRDIERVVGLLNSYDMVMAVAFTFDPNASRIDQIPFPTKFVEKKAISEFGMVSARAFRNAGKLTKALEETLEYCAAAEMEPYLSYAMNEYDGTKYAHLITEYQDWGTPERIAQNGATIITPKDL